MCVEKIVKILVTIINFALWISGILLIVFGAIALGSPSTMVSMLNLIPGVYIVTPTLFNPYSVFEGMAIFMIVLGSLLFLFGGVGCHGIWTMHKRMMCNYWILLILGVLCEIAMIVYGAVYPPTTENFIQLQLYDSLNTTFQPVTINDTTVTYSSNENAYDWETLQSQSQCCGAYGPSDYTTFTWGQPANQTSLPPTCCKTKTAQGINVTSTAQFVNLAACTTFSAEYWPNGCWNNVIDMVYQFDDIAIIIAAILMAVQLIGIILTAHAWHKMVRETGY